MTRRLHRPVVAALVAACLVACGRQAEENVAPRPAGATPAADAAPPGVTLIPHERLAARIPQLDGWTREAPVSATVSLPAPAAHATATYVRGRARIDLEITDTGGHPDYVGSLAKVAGTTFTQQASNGYLKGATLEGIPAVESWNHVDRLGDISLLVDRRFIVHATGTGLDRIETLRALVTSVKLADLR